MAHGIQKWKQWFLLYTIRIEQWTHNHFVQFHVQHLCVHICMYSYRFVRKWIPAINKLLEHSVIVFSFEALCIDRFRLTAHIHNIYVSYKCLVSNSNSQTMFTHFRKKKTLHSCRSANDHWHTCFVGWKTILRWKTRTAKHKESERQLRHLSANSQTSSVASHFFRFLSTRYKSGLNLKESLSQHSFVRDVNVFHLGKVVLINFLHTHSHSYSHSHSHSHTRTPVYTHNGLIRMGASIRAFVVFAPPEQLTKFFFLLQLHLLLLLLPRFGVLICLILTKDCGNQKRTQYILQTHLSFYYRSSEIRVNTVECTC